MKNRKKTMLTLLCAMLLIVASVAGTLAYLTEKTEAVVNTFTVGKLVDDDDDDSKFELKEHTAVYDEATGLYSLSKDETDKNSYKVFPGVDIPKDPFVRVSKLESPAWMFVEVKNALPEVFGVTVEDTFTALPDVTGANGGQIYAYNTKLLAGADEQIIYILAEKTVTVADAEIKLTQGTDDTLSFYAYLIQAPGFDTAEAAWDAAYPAAAE